MLKPELWSIPNFRSQGSKEEPTRATRKEQSLRRNQKHVKVKERK